MNATLTVGDLDFELRRSSRRKTMQITVDRSGELVLIAPEACGTAALERFVREKRFWIYTKLAEKESLRRPPTTKEFVTGEGFPYLGKSHRLLLVDHQDVPLKLHHGRFKLLRTEASRGRKHFVAWYTDRASSWIANRVRRLAPKAGVEPSRVEIRDLGYRWGSCGKHEIVNFHWATILLPPSVIDYIIVHELVHLHEAHHTPAFWTRLERALPDFTRRRKWLADNGMELQLRW